MAVKTQAQVRQGLIDSLDNLGSSKSDFNEGGIFTAAENNVADFISRVQENINASNMIVTGAISQMKVVILEDEIQVVGNDWLLYQDRGVKGSKSSAKAPNSPHAYTDKMPPRQVFIDYIKEKNLLATNQAQFFTGESPFKDLTDEEKIEQMAILMQKYIFENGFKPRNVFAKEIPQLTDELKVSIKDFGVKSIKEVFNFNR